MSWTIEVKQPAIRVAARLAHPLLRWGHDRVVDVTVAGFRWRLDSLDQHYRAATSAPADTLLVTSGEQDDDVILAAMASSAGEGDGQAGQAPEMQAAVPRWLPARDQSDVGETLEKDLEPDSCLEAREWSARAEVGTSAECEVAAHRTERVEAVGIVVDGRVAIGRSPQELHACPGRDGGAADGHVAGC